MNPGGFWNGYEKFNIKKLLFKDLKMKCLMCPRMYCVYVNDYIQMLCNEQPEKMEYALLRN